MKEIKRYTLINHDIRAYEHECGELVRFTDYEKLQATIKELESDKHINEIKAQVIADYLENDLLQYVNSYDANYGVSVDHIESEIKKLRNKNEKRN